MHAKNAIDIVLSKSLCITLFFMFIVTFRLFRSLAERPEMPPTRRGRGPGGGGGSPARARARKSRGGRGARGALRPGIPDFPEIPGVPGGRKTPFSPEALSPGEIGGVRLGARFWPRNGGEILCIWGALGRPENGPAGPF